MSARLEAFLARIYVDESAREAYLANPRGETEGAGLASAERAALGRLDPAGLRLAARSFAAKRAHALRPSVLHRLAARLHRLYRRWFW